MSFGPYSENEVFRIEDSSIYLRFRNKGVKTVDFVLFRENNKLIFVEAKSSVPNVAENGDPKGSIQELADKLLHSASIFTSLVAGQNKTDDIPIPLWLSGLDMSQTRVAYVIIVSKAERDHLPPIRDSLLGKLCELLSVHANIWNFDLRTSISVITKEQAIRIGLAVED